MAKWRFWNRTSDASEQQKPVVPVTDIAPQARGFQAPTPRLDQSTPAALEVSPVQARLYQQRDAIRADVQQAEIALQSENPWTARIREIESALTNIEADLAHNAMPPEHIDAPIPDLLIDDIAVTDVPAPSVSFHLAGHPVQYASEIDWAERGNTVYRGELIGGPDQTLYSDQGLTRLANLPWLAPTLSHILLAYAVSIHEEGAESARAGQPRSLRDIAAICERDGQWRDLNGVCLACESRSTERLLLTQEQQRLLAQRDAEINDRNRTADRLPIARRRLAEIEQRMLATEQ